MILCATCGHPNQEGTRFCTACGATLEESNRALAQLILVGPGESGTSHLLCDRPVSIGRGMANDVIVEETHVSQRHARVFYQDGVFWVEDLQSTNGTYVNGERIEGPTRLITGDLLKIGAMILRFERLGPT